MKEEKKMDEKSKWVENETKRLSKIIKNSKVLSEKDMKCFDVLYNIDNKWREIFNQYRSSSCMIEEALISGILYFSKYNKDIKKIFDEIK